VERHKGTCLSGGLSSPTAKRFSYYLIQPKLYMILPFSPARNRDPPAALPLGSAARARFLRRRARGRTPGARRYASVPSAPLAVAPCVCLKEKLVFYKLINSDCPWYRVHYRVSLQGFSISLRVSLQYSSEDRKVRWQSSKNIINCMHLPIVITLKFTYDTWRVACREIRSDI